MNQYLSAGMRIHGLAHAASGYHRVLEENRKLYNQVQDLKGSIRVYCRVRPFLPGQSSFSSTIGNMEDDSISINTASRHGKSLKSFTFNKVFGPSASQGNETEMPISYSPVVELNLKDIYLALCRGGIL